MEPHFVGGDEHETASPTTEPSPGAGIPSELEASPIPPLLLLLAPPLLLPLPPPLLLPLLPPLPPLLPPEPLPLELPVPASPPLVLNADPPHAATTTSAAPLGGIQATRRIPHHTAPPRQVPRPCSREQSGNMPSVKTKTLALLLTLIAIFVVPSCGSKSSQGPAPVGTVSDDPVWGPAATICPSAAANPSAPPLLGTDCDPLDPTYCGLPFPSNVYLVKDPTGKNPSGMSVRFGANTLPPLYSETPPKPVDPSLFYGRDGYSALQAAEAHFPGAVAVGNSPASTLPDANHIATSVDATKSPTILLETTSGKLMPHFSEIDVQPKDPTERSLLVHPVIRLKDETRYIVAIRNVQDGSGNTLPPSPFFKALLDQYNGNANPCSPSMVALRQSQYTDIFAKLKAAGVDLASLQMAWDYTTASSDSNTQDLVFMRDDALKNYPNGFKFSVYKATVNPSTLPSSSPWYDDDEVWIRIDATITLPLYLNFSQPFDPSKPTILPQINRGPDGKPKQNGEFDFPIVIHVPISAQPSKNPAAKSFGLVQNGHGLLGDRFEGSGAEGTPPPRNFLTHLGNVYHYVTFAVNLMGFATDVDITGVNVVDDKPLVEEGLSGDPKAILALFQRQVQGHLNQLLAMRFMIQNLAQLVADPKIAPTGLSAGIVDPAQAFWRGDSQGGIMGGVYMAASTDVKRGLLGETGVPYNLLLERSQDWKEYALELNGNYNAGQSQQMALQLFQMWWDTSEPSGYAAHITSNPLPCPSCPGGVTPVKQALLYDGLGDCQVTAWAAHVLARTIGAKQLSPVAREIYGVTDAASIPAPGSGIVEWSFGLPPAPLTDTGPALACCGSNNDPHDKISMLQPAYDQLDHFYRTGNIEPYCNDVCSCYEAPMYKDESNCSILPKPDWTPSTCPGP